MLTRERMRELIEQHGLSRVADEIMTDTRTCIRLKLDYAADETIPVGTSKMGGSPDVPQGFEWPVWNDLPLTFIAQIRLSEAKPFDEENLLPEDGILYFFFDDEAYGKMRYVDMLGTTGPYKVIYLRDERTPLVRMPHPLVINDGSYEVHEYEAGIVSFERDLSFIFKYSLIHPNVVRGEQTFLTENERDKYSNCWIAANNEMPRRLHQLLGYEFDVQNAFQATINAYSAWQIGEPEDWILLLQVDTDDVDAGQNRPGFLWGDGGLIHCCINKYDLRAGNFDRVWLDCVGA